MRTISQNLVDKLTTTREVNARLTIRDNRIVFTTRVLDDSLGLSDPSTADACLHGTGILRVVNSGDTLYSQYVPDMTLLTWPLWVSEGVTLKTGSRPGVEGSRMWYQKANGDICYQDYGQSEVLVTSAYASFVVTCAPVSTSTCYIHYLDGPWGAIARIHETLGPVDWSGRIYGDLTTARYFDAAQLGGVDYLFVADKNDGRLLTIESQGGVWSDARYVIPLDVVDTNSFFRLAYACVLNSQIWVTGRLSRSDDYGTNAFDIYTIGPGNYTMGRELYIDSGDTGGKLFVVDEVLYYVGTNLVGEADATQLVGNDHANHKLLTQELYGFDLSCSENRSYKSTIDLPGSFSSALLRRGSDVTLEVAVGDEWAQMAVLGVDRIEPAYTEEGQSLRLYARSAAGKRLDQWVSDQNYDYWSQTKQSSDPATLEEVIRANGIWEVSQGPLELTQLNTEGVLYMVERSARGGLMRAKFQKPAGTSFTPEYGVAINYYRETRYDAAERLGLDVENVTDDLIGNNGIVAVWGETQHQGGAGVGVYLWRNSVMAQLTTAALSIPDDTWHWLMITFQDGLVKVFYRLDSSTSWTEVTSFVFNDPTYMPWKRETFGRGAIYVKNGTPNSTTPGFQRSASIVPVSDNSPFPASETVLVNEEQITYSAKSPTTGPADEPADGFEVVEGILYDGAPHTNPYTGPFTGNAIFLDTADPVQTDHSAYNDMALVVLDGPGAGNAFKITDYDYISPKTWTPSGTYTPPDKWEDHIGDTNYGAWTESTMRRVFLEEDPGSLVGPGAKVAFKPALIVSARGANNTTQATHGSATVSLYRDLSVACDRVEYYTLDDDMSIEDMARELATKAGITSFDFDQVLSGNQVFSGAGWTAPVWISDRKNFIVRFAMPTLDAGEKVGVVFRSPTQPADHTTLTQGYRLVVTDTDQLEFSVAGAGGFVLQETFDLGFTPVGDVKISVQDDAFSVWVGKRFVYTFRDGTWTGGANAGLLTYGTVTVDVSWSNLDRRQDNYILDMGQKGSQLMDGLINQRRIYYHDGQTGNFKMFRARDDIGTLPDLLVDGDVSTEEGALVSRIRSEGAEIAEVVDFAKLREEGNLFGMVNAHNANDAWEAYQEGDLVLKERAAEAIAFQAQMAADPRVEPNDVVTIVYPDGTHQMIVDAVDFSFKLTKEEALFDMRIRGKDAAWI